MDAEKNWIFTLELMTQMHLRLIIWTVFLIPLPFLFLNLGKCIFYSVNHLLTLRNRFTFQISHVDYQGSGRRESSAMLQSKIRCAPPRDKKFASHTSLNLFSYFHLISSVTLTPSCNYIATLHLLIASVIRENKLINIYHPS